MAKKTSAGILPFRRKAEVEVFLVHPGGPFWARKDTGAWSLPKGEFATPEDLLTAAKREFKEETSFVASGQFIELEPVKQPSGKIIFAWALEYDCDATKIKSNTFSMIWPPGLGREQEFPEVDRALWLTLTEAEIKLSAGQLPFLKQLKDTLSLV